jgi:nucleotide-binding universal stress UspA family protein
MKVKSILFPVDFSPGSVAIVPHVEAAARRFGAAVTLLHLVETPVMPYGPVETLAFPGLQPGALRAKAEELMERFADTAFAGLRVRRWVDTGDPAFCIAALARDWDIDLIMMPTHGRGVLRAALLGSITSKVLHDAECPVWTAAHADNLPPGRHVDWKKIVCALGASPEGRRLLQAAQDLHDTLGIDVHVVHAVPGEEAFPQRLMDQEFANILRQRADEEIAEMQYAAGTKFDVSIETGDVTRAVARYACNAGADLVLVGRGEDRSRGNLHSHTYGVIRDAPCPVLSI